MALITPTMPGMVAKPDRAYSEVIDTTEFCGVIMDSTGTLLIKASI